MLLTTYNAVGRSIINYTAPIWTQTISDRCCKDLQKKQNTALCTITSCYIMALKLHLHHEAKIMPIKQHNAILSTQFLLGTHKDERPDHLTTQPLDTDARTIRMTLHDKFQLTWPTLPLWRTWTSAATKKASPTSTNPLRPRRQACTP